MGHGPGGHVDRFAVAVALAAVAATIGVYFAWTQPALAEYERIDAVEAGQLRLRAELRSALEATRQRQLALTWDLQTVLVAIDEAGATPAELLGPDLLAADPAGLAHGR